MKFKNIINAEQGIQFGDGTTQNTAPTGGGSGPTGPAGGDLSGTYPNPQIAAGAITDADVAAANKDGLAATASLRTLGTGAQQAAAGNDARLSDARTPSGAAGGDLTGTYPNPTLRATLSDPAAGTAGLRTLGTGAAQAAAGNDARLSDARTPTGAAGGDLAGTYPNPTIAPGVITDTDVAAANKDGVAGTASLRTLGTGAQQAAAGNDARLSDARAPTGAAGGSLAGTYPNPTIAPLAVTAAEVAAANKDGVAATASMRTLGKGAQQAAPGDLAAVYRCAYSVGLIIPGGLAAGSYYIHTDGTLSAVLASGIATVSKPVAMFSKPASFDLAGLSNVAVLRGSILTNDAWTTSLVATVSLRTISAASGATGGQMTLTVPTAGALLTVQNNVANNVELQYLGTETGSTAAWPATPMAFVLAVSPAIPATATAMLGIQLYFRNQ